MLASGILILAAVVGLTLYAVWRRHDDRRPSSNFLIVGGGLVFTPAVLAALLVWGLGAGHSMLPLSTDRDVLRIEVRGHQWWWEVVYGGGLYSANEIHIPAGRPVDILVRSDDVIHSFWVPRLGGKIDAIPGHTNRIRLKARRPGVFRGQCAEFCGAQHARMGLMVQAHEEAAFEARLALLATQAAAPEHPGQAIFEQNCAACHSLDPRRRSPEPGPNLADLPHRMTLGAATLANGRAELRQWLAEHASLKPGNRMPPHDHLDAEAIEALAAYLEGEP